MSQCIQCGRRMAGFGFGKKLCPWCVQHERAQKAAASGVEDDAVQPVMPAPWVARGHEFTLPVSITHLLVGINAAVFVGMAMAGVSFTQPTNQQLIHWGANFGPLTLGGQWWRLITSCFLHIGIIHIGFNMWCLWDLGALAEMLYGPWTFAAVYLISGVAGMVASVWWRFGGISAGASGAIFGLAGALAMSFYLGEFSLPRNAIMGQFRSLILFVGYNLLFGAVAGHIDNAAHIGGLVSGGILGALIARAAPDRELWPRRLGILAAALGIVVAATFGLQHAHAYMVHLQRGSELLEQKRPGDAVGELQTAVKLKPNDLASHFALAQAYWNQQQWPNAEAELQRVIELDPRIEDAYYDLTLAYRNEGRTDQARAVADKLLQRNPRSAQGHRALANADFDEKNYAAALKEYQLAAELSPQEEGLFFDLGQCYAKLGDYGSAISAYQTEIQNSGESSETEAAMAEAYRAKGMTKEADAAEQKVSKKKPGE